MTTSTPLNMQVFDMLSLLQRIRPIDIGFHGIPSPLKKGIQKRFVFDGTIPEGTADRNTPAVKLGAL